MKIIPDKSILFSPTATVLLAKALAIGLKVVPYSSQSSFETTINVKSTVWYNYIELKCVCDQESNWDEYFTKVFTQEHQLYVDSRTFAMY